MTGETTKKVIRDILRDLSKCYCVTVFHLSEKDRIIRGSWKKVFKITISSVDCSLDVEVSEAMMEELEQTDSDHWTSVKGEIEDMIKEELEKVTGYG